MTFLDDNHLSRMKRFELIYERMKNLEEFARENGIHDIFQDNGAKILQQISILNLQDLEGREGNDAVDECGQEWELKSYNVNNSSGWHGGFSTNHHLTAEIIDKYRKANWAFSFYDGIHLLRIYVIAGADLEPFYQKWLEKLKTQDTLNNPKIPIKWILDNAFLAYPINYDEPVDPADPATWSKTVEYTFLNSSSAKRKTDAAT